MAYGYTTAAPMDDGYVPSSPYTPGRPVLEGGELPALKDASVDAMGRRNTLAKALPAMPESEMGDLSYTNYRAIDQAEQMQAFAVGQADRKYAEKVNRYEQKAEEAYATEEAERMAKGNHSNMMRRSRYADARDRAAAYQAIRNLSGPNVYQYMFPIR